MFTILDQRKQATIQWLQNQNQSNRDSLKNVRREANRQCRNNERDYLIGKIILKPTVRTRISETCTVYIYVHTHTHTHIQVRLHTYIYMYIIIYSTREFKKGLPAKN